ncbi:putative RNA-directed DNA polymerase [Tanacetum coccineum]
MECVSTTSFSISINGSLHGYFKGKRGLRQGDPLSPYLFTLVMEILTLMLKRKVRLSNSFSFHRYCSKLELINLCFADDLFLFSHGDTLSTMVIKEALEEFTCASGLVPSLSKSTAYFCNVVSHTKTAILQILPFGEGRLSVKYLGVPLVSSRLIYRDCKELIEKVQDRVQDWKNKSLSIAGRLQLAQSVLGSMHIYWASVFILPSRVLLDIEQIIRGFLWCQGIMRKGKANVAWEDVCRPKKEGGLGLRRLDEFNKALMISHVWKLISLKESLWVQWIHEYKIRGRNFWDIPFRGNMTWGWRKILQLRPVMRDFIWYKIGDGARVSMWFDRWNDMCPLANHISTRDIFHAGFNLSTKVHELVLFGAWNWPHEWYSKYQFLSALPAPNISNNVQDLLEWRLPTGKVLPFSVQVVWNSIRSRGADVVWYDMVWFSNCIPRHAFNMWLILLGRLKTQDKLRPWDLSAALSVSCPLCNSQPDSQEHLFFECGFSQQLWSHVKKFACMDNMVPMLNSIISYLSPIAQRRSTRCVIAKLVVAASAYFIWQERNWRLFKNKKRSATQVIECIVSSVRLKLLSCRFKKSKDGVMFAQLWDLPESVFISS